ncbi:DNA-formamidopyrimidine glycosylase [Bacillus atrophaeus]|uniref:Formamidopyrimidine-DNA glycosylase n=1 Tax=Bacillus atrophaeus (strain 1942) TaxID=720555 RepID=A0ABM5LZP0_BACA1|nr:DNA-formamidopyrimidine glycosylase [Bacillus atrophaeus]AMR61850.1 DNA-formamidopyrimidine glycosylase [Bacillus subtilis subsp. globigii]ADP33396.1 formamidopyrimidine-DNA glycosylase [Bacillus atrophaeus 1942]AIK48782.1 formamidopyrimidine-DNA glycosylase [Bacillus atrophaeus subsp. globigii]ATO27990.1 DNA-formamidopyrimidine glycosylase [Bacillus atrophaeus]EIM12762.1 formamidopyrimidine/5-formyluracil/ 5-hydroxymethyluracil DNA glycosylase [Bacillus atrophaeus C89]
MPELPEVETVRRTLTGLVRGKTIKSVEIRWPNIIKRPAEPEEFARNLIGETIQSIGRRGKFLLFHLDHFVMVSHLRMEGKYGLHQAEDPDDKHVHVVFTMTDGTQLRYRDVRKFGTMHLFHPGEEMRELPLSQLGPEPDDKEFTDAYLKERLMKTNRAVKTALLDQKAVVGLGNIYVDEALFRAGIHPETKANQLSAKKIKKLHEEIKNTLQEAIDAGGSTVRSYINSQGEIGMFQLRHFVYGKKDKPCKTCGTMISKIVVGGRGTHFCAKCQKQ